MQSSRRSSSAHKSGISLKDQLEDLQEEQLLFQSRQEIWLERWPWKHEPSSSELILLLKEAQEHLDGLELKSWHRGSRSADLCEDVGALRRGLNLAKVQQQHVTRPWWAFQQACPGQHTETHFAPAAAGRQHCDKLLTV